TGIGPCEACACQVEAAQGVAVFGKGKERGADVVDETRQGAFDRVKRAARPLLGLEEKHAPTVAGQRRGCHEPVRASAHHDGIEHACDPGWLRIRRTAPYARRTVRLESAYCSAFSVSLMTISGLSLKRLVLVGLLLSSQVPNSVGFGVFLPPRMSLRGLWACDTNLAM